MKTTILTLLVLLGSVTASFAVDKDRGGANGYEGRPLESYIKDPKALPAYKNFVKKIQDQVGVDYLSSYIEYVLSQKTWYFVNDLKHTLPSEKIGAAVQTEQIALQDFETVWIDNGQFNAPKMSEIEQAKVILHEVLMGIKLLRFQSKQEQCQAVAASPSSWRCENLPTTRVGSPSQLTPTDYNEIRQTVVDLLTLTKDLPYGDREKIQDLLARRHFNNETASFRTSDKNIEDHYIDDNRKAIKDAFISGVEPKHLFSFSDFYESHPEIKTGQDIVAPLFWKASGSCSMHLTEASDGSLNVFYTSSSVPETSFKLNIGIGSDGIYETNYRNPLDPNQKVFPAWGRNIDIPKTKQEGDRYIQIQFLGDIYQGIEGAHILEYVVVSDYRSVPALNGINEICSVNSQIELRP